jgi:hypothetical protein
MEISMVKLGKLYGHPENYPMRFPSKIPNLIEISFLFSLIPSGKLT